MYVSFDPGETTGVVVWNDKGEPVKIEQFNQQGLDNFLTQIDNVHYAPVHAFIIEEYRPYSHINHTGSKIYTVQVIGQIKAFARKWKIEVVEQRADIKRIAAMWSQTQVPRGHMPDWMAAFLHGYYYLHKKGIIKAKVLDK